MVGVYFGGCRCFTCWCLKCNVCRLWTGIHWGFISSGARSAVGGLVRAIRVNVHMTVRSVRLSIGCLVYRERIKVVFE